MTNDDLIRRGDAEKLARLMARGHIHIDALEDEIAALPAITIAEALVAERDDLRVKLDEAAAVLESWVELAAHCNIEEGVCCCGDDMKNHSVPMHCGHSPTDHGEYIAKMLVETTRTALAKIKGADHE